MANDAFALSLENAEPSDAVFEAIQDAVMETARGRWFLIEYARRNRHADTAILLAALNRIEGLVRVQQEGQPALNGAAANPAPIKPEGSAEGKAAAHERVLTEAAARLRGALGPVRELAARLRGRGDPRCELLDIRASEIAQTCEMFETLQTELNAPASPARLLREASEQTTKDAQRIPTPAFRIAASMPEDLMEAKVGAPDDFGSETEDAIGAMAFADGEDPMPGILAAAQKMAQAAPPAADRAQAASAPAVKETPPPAMPKAAAQPAPKPAPEQPAPAAPRMNPSDRLRGLFNELHQARWGSQGDNPAAPAAEAKPLRTGDVRDAWPRASAHPAAAARHAAPAAAPAPAAQMRNDPLAPIMSLSDEERIALFS